MNTIAKKNETLPPGLYVKIKGALFQVESFADASGKYLEAMNSLDMGAEEAYEEGYAGCQIYNHDGILLGHISYNGRVWEGTAQSQDSNTKLLYDPYDKNSGSIFVSHRWTNETN